MGGCIGVKGVVHVGCNFSILMSSRVTFFNGLSVFNRYKISSR